MRHPVDPSTYDASDPFGSMSGGRQYPHTGSDYAVAFAEVYAPCDGVVYKTGRSDGNGNYCTLYLPGHDWDGVEGGAYMAFIHMDSVNVAEGNTVKEGQKLGVSGNTGTNSRGPHLHVTLSNSDQAALGIGSKVSAYDWIQSRLKPVAPPAPVKPPTTVAKLTTKARLLAERRQFERDLKRAQVAKKQDANKIATIKRHLAATIEKLARLDHPARKK